MDDRRAWGALKRLLNPVVIIPITGGAAWRVLTLGFGGLLLLNAFAGLDALMALKQVRTSNAQIRLAYLNKNRALEQIRSGIYLSGTSVRDYLLSVTPWDAQEHRATFHRVQHQTDEALRSYAQTLYGEEASAFRSLQAEIYTYWRVLDQIFERDNAQIRQSGSPYFYNQLALRRTAMLELADRISAVNDRDLTAGEEKVAETFDRFRLRQVGIFIVSIVVGIALAVLTILYVLRLERQAKIRYDESVRARTELKELSARLVEAQEQERKAIARELHDEVGQTLTALLMDAGTAAVIAPRQAEDLQRRLESVKDLAERSVNVVRNMALLLRPSMLDDLGLVPALQWQAREVSKRTGLKVRISAEGVPDDLPDEHKTCIYRVVQEALNNCAKHAQAHTVKVQVQVSDDGISLSIQDDGAGFDARQVRGMGLLGMEERIAHVGGFLKIESVPGKGTMLLAQLPLRAHALAVG